MMGSAEAAGATAESRIRGALDGVQHQTEFYASRGRCSFGEAVVILMRLERLGVVERGWLNGFGAMTWKARRP